ncbi:MAG: TolC family protein [Candidatus Scalindua sp.]
MIYPAHHIKSVTIVTLLASVLFLTSNVSMAQVSDPTRREEIKTKTVNLKECITIAFENNLQLAAERKRLDLAEAERIKASLLLPANPKLGSETGARESSSTGRDTDYTIALSQEFEVFGQRRKRIRVAEKNIERVRFEIHDVERIIISSVKLAFYEVLTSLEIAKLRESVKDIFERLWDATRERYKAGAISALELNSIKIKYGLARQQLLVAKKDHQNRLLNLKLLLGKSGDEALNIEGKLSYEKLQTNMEDILASAYKTRPDLKAIEFEKERASKEISLRKAEIIPNLDLSGFFTRESGTDDILGGGVSISIPIWDRKQSELKKARTAKDVANINIKKRYLEIQKEVETSYRSFMAAKEGIVIYKDEIMPQVNESLKLNEISYKEGKINFIGFLTVQSDLIETQAAYLNALLDYNNAIINLETVSGVKLQP